jgi:hypothetical protein
MDWERRTLYRAGLSHEVFVAMGIDALVPGRLENLTAEGARVAFDSVPTEFMVGEKVRITFSSGRLPERIELGGELKYVSSSAVGVAFDLPETAASEIFNRRSAFRAAPRDRDGKAMVGLRRNNREIGRGRLIDISITGLAVLIDPEVAAGIEDHVDLQIFLPDNTLSIGMAGVIGERRRVGDDMRLSIVLRPQGAEGQSNQRIIYDFVVRRQRDLIRQLMNVMAAQPGRIPG